MKLQIYSKIYALPLGILLVSFGFYYFVLDSLDACQQQHTITITHTQNPQSQQNDDIDEQKRMREELEKIKQSANVDFIYNVLAENLNRINSYANIEFEDTMSSIQVAPKQQLARTTQKNKMKSINYVPYRQIHTHELPNAFRDNPNAPTDIKLYGGINHFDIKNTLISQKKQMMQWAIPMVKEAKIYRTPNIHAKVLAVNKNGIKMQVVAIKKSWVHVRYTTIKKSFIDGYIPIRNIRLIKYDL